MTSYVFGLFNLKTRIYLKYKLGNITKKNIEELVLELSEESGPHILPVLIGYPEDVKRIRARYFQLLKKVLPQAEIEKIIQAELMLALKLNNPKLIIGEDNNV